MTKKLLTKFWLRLCMIVAIMTTALTASAAEEVYSTCLFGADYNSQKIGSYTATWTATNGDFTWTIVNGNNNNNGWAFVKFGRKNNASVGAIITEAAYPVAITKVDLTIDALTAANVNSIKLYTSADNSAWTEAGSFSKATGTQTVDLASPATSLYYKIEFDCASGSANGLVTVSKVEYYYNTGGAVAPSITAADLSISYDSTEGEIEYTVNNPVTGGTLTAATESDWLTVGEVEDLIPFECAVNEGAEREATVTLTYAYGSESVTKNVTVTQAANPNGPGSEANPYTVAQARAAIDAGTGITGVYATGIVSKIVTAYNSQYGNISYNISEDGTETADQLQAYRGFSYNGDWFTSADDIQVGDVVVVYGNLKKYNSTYEFDSGNQLVSLDRPVVTTPSITVDPTTVNAPYAGTSGTIDVTYNNVVTGVGTYFEWYTDATGATATTEEPNWITIGFDTENNVTYTIAQNDGSEPRTAYMKVWGYYDPQTTVYSDVITFTQNAYVAGCATLNFVWDGGKADIESTAGLSQEGLGNDYNNSPKLKFDSTGDWLMLQFNERASKLTFDIKGNSFSDGTFTVQTSEDGVTFTDLKTYTSFSTITEKEVFDNLDENVRYIKWVYTEKVTGNVALGNISVEKYSADPAISISPITVNVDAVATEGTLDIRLDNITISDMAQFEVRYLTASLESTTQPEWLDVVVAEQDPSVGEGYVVSYTVLDNDGEARSAYFQVYGLDDDGSTEALSQVVTIEQAAYVAPADDYATLPFEWAGGVKDDLLAEAGVTANGLGSDYAASNAPYCVKFDTTGDYIQVKTNERPGIVTIGVKMLGGATESAITVLESADGENFTELQDLTISGSQNTELTLKTTTVFAEDTRYVRLSFTKGSNVGVGPISIAQYADIVTSDYYLTIADPANVSITATYGEELLQNGESAYVTEGTEVTVALNIASGYDFESLTITGEEEGQTVTPSPGTTEGVYTFTMPDYNVTVNATVVEHVEPVTSAYVLATSITSGKRYVIASGTEGTVQVMAEQRNNNRGVVAAEITNGVLNVSDEYEFVIESASTEDASGYSIYDEDIPGYLYAAASGSNHLKTESALDNNGIWTITFNADGSASIVAESSSNRNVMQYNGTSTLFSCYGSASQAPVYLFEKVETIQGTQTVTVTSAGYATMVAEANLEIPAGVEVFAVKISGTTAILNAVTSGIPAGEAVLVRATEGDYDFPYATGSVDRIENNELVPATTDISADGTQFVLAKPAGSPVGFYQATGTIPAGKAYLIYTGAGVKGFTFDDDATAIEMVNGQSSMGNGQPIYNLAGQIVNGKLTKGIYIVNGKKVAVK